MRYACGVVAWLLLSMGTATAAAQVALVERGKAAATVIRPDKAAGDEELAAKELVAYVQKMTGARLPVVAEGKAAKGRKIFIGATEAARKAGVDASKLDRDGFILRVLNGDLYIAGYDPTATCLGVHFFLQRYGGIRWYMPLELGEHVPTRQSLAVPADLNDVQEPDWKSRLWSSPSRMDPLWPRRNLCRARYGFHHNLLHIFTPDLYAKHPEWFPLRNGKRYRPRDESDHSWQPCFASQEAVHHAAETIIAHFDAHPEATSFSIGVNDSNGYCQCDACKALDDPKKPTFRGRPNWSNRFFTFANRVAEQVAKRHPHKLIGCLAYSCCEEVPSFPVHPNVIPYLTNDRSQWRDAAFCRTDQDLLIRWSKAARQIGVYDYYYGSGYVIPRLYPQISAWSIKFCHRIGVRAWYAEIYSNWALDGPKAWVASQLLWDVDQDVNDLLDDYYRNFYGAAAEPMRRYWTTCERIWEDQGGTARWWKGFFDATQLELFPPETIQTLTAHLDEAAKLAKTDLVSRRIAFFRKGLRYTELYSTLYHANKRLPELSLRTKADLAKAVALVKSLAESGADLERYESEVIMKDPLLKPCIPFRERCRNAPTASASGAMVSVVALARTLGQKDEVRSLLRALAGQPGGAENTVIARAMLAWLDRDPAKDEEQLANAGFEAAGADVPQQKGIDWSKRAAPPGWSSWVRPNTTAQLSWLTGGARAGKRAARIAGATAACYCATVPVKPGEVYVATIYARAEVAESNETSFWVQWQDAKRQWAQAAAKKSVQLPAGKTDGWVPLRLAFVVPKGVAFAVIGCGANRQGPDDYAVFDDCALIRLPLPSGP
ncbi:DUF4838 domain-containing protein [bacterium]|nr:DUF4838 domain-containing protein [bacterium]